MNLKKTIFILPIIAFLYGWLILGHLAAGILFTVGVVYVQSLLSKQNKANQRTDRVFTEENDFIHIILLLSAAVIKADGRIYKKELHLVRARLSHDFDPEKVERYMISLDKYLKRKININLVCDSAKTNLDYASKIQLLHFLVGLSVTNNLIVDAEFDLLRKIASIIDVPERSFASVLAMFNYRRINSYNKSGSNNQQQYKSTSGSELSRAYRILEIEAGATTDEIKKAYRKLAKIHHPDLVAHLGSEFQKNAKGKFQKIADAYDLIKTRNGFK